MQKTGRLEDALKSRATALGVWGVRIADELPADARSRHLGDQLMRCATSVGAHIREGNRARTDAEFTSKLNVATQEAAEAQHWLEVMARTSRGERNELREFHVEADELIAIFTSIVVQVDPDR